MGAWGHGHFENDTAADFVWDVEESSDPKQRIAQALYSAINADYIEADAGSEAIAAGAYIDCQANGTKFVDADGIGPLEVDNFPENHPTISLLDLKSTAVQALQKVLMDNSELNELWAENEEDYSLWRKEVEAMIQRLES
jgi:hypothetical protein